MAFLEGSVLQQIMRMHSYRDDKNFFSGLLLSRHVYDGILCRGTQQLFYLFGDANIAKNFLLLEDGWNFLDDHSIHVQFFSKLIQQIPSDFLKS